jgi:hypothetical protein
LARLIGSGRRALVQVPLSILCELVLVAAILLMALRRMGLRDGLLRSGVPPFALRGNDFWTEPRN